LKHFLSLLLFFYTVSLSAQTVRQPISAFYPAIGVYSKNLSDPFTMIVNPASLANIKSAGAGVYSERRFLLDAFNQFTGVGAFKTSSGNFGFQADYFGNKNYNESQLGLGYARSLGSKVDVGAKFNYYNLQIPAYGNASTFHFEAGVLMHLSDKLHAGVSVFNPVGGELNKETNEKIAAVYRGGLGYEVSDKFFVTAEMVKEENKNIAVNAAFQYIPVQQLIIRAGINTLNEQPFAGVGLRMGQLRLDLATSYHPQMGISPAVLLLYQFSKPGE
jgi:hypothetical protein